MQICVVSFRILCPDHCDFLFFAAGEFRFERYGNFLGDVTFDTKDVDHFAIVSVGPKMIILERVDQLYRDAHLIARFLDAALENIGDAELLCDLAQIAGRALIFLG